MLDAIPREEIVAAMDRMVDELLHAAGIEAPPVDVIALAQNHLGMEICLDGRQRQRGRAQRVAGKKQIFLRPEPSEERHQWTVAHEKALEKEGNGLFTRAVLDGLSRKEGVPFNTSSRLFYVHHLHSYVFDRVSDLSGGRQHPFLSLPWVVESFPVAQFATK